MTPELGGFLGQETGNATGFRGRTRYSWYLLRRNPLSIAGGALLSALILAALLGPAISSYDPEKPDIEALSLPPSALHLMGTDENGMDIFTRVLYAARLDLSIAVLGVGAAILVGVTIGALAGFYGGLADDVAMRLLDSQQAFPTYVLAMVVAVALGPGTINVILVVAFVDYPIIARLVRAEMLSAKERMYADAAVVVGNSTPRIIFRHLLPNCIGPVYVSGSLLIGGAVLLTATLSFLGLGVKVPTPEWGIMISQGARAIVLGQWWMSFFPGMMIWICVMAWNLLGDGLQDVLDPKRR